jgi:preprotein translocase subunit SecF
VSTVSIDPTALEEGHGRFKRLYYGQTRFDFVRRRKLWFGFSAAVILAGIVSLGVRGLNFDIEFVGGTSWTAPAHGVTVQQVQKAIGLPGATITTLGSGSHESIQVEAKLGSNGKAATSAQVTRVQAILAHLTHQKSINAVTTEQVGPTWGGQITHKAIVALIVFFILIAIYISIFFEWKMALAAIIAVAHDILVTVGIYSLTYFLVTPDTVVAFLTVLGYSLYDTIVVFDRVRDNMKGLGATGKLTFTDVVNLSMNQTLARSINTSLVAILPILAVLVLGADVLGATTLQYFGLALFIGLTSGAYSSIFIASPLVAVMKERESRYTQIRQRLEARGTATQLLSPAAVAAGALEDRSQQTGGGGRRRRRTGSAQLPASGPLRPGSSRQGAPPAPPATSRPGARAGTANIGEPLEDAVVEADFADSDLGDEGFEEDEGVVAEAAGGPLRPGSASRARSQPQGRPAAQQGRPAAQQGRSGGQQGRAAGGRPGQPPRPRKKRRR